MFMMQKCEDYNRTIKEKMKSCSLDHEATYEFNCDDLVKQPPRQARECKVPSNIGSVDKRIGSPGGVCERTCARSDDGDGSSKEDDDMTCDKWLEVNGPKIAEAMTKHRLAHVAAEAQGNDCWKAKQKYQSSSGVVLGVDIIAWRKKNWDKSYAELRNMTEKARVLCEENKTWSLARTKACSEAWNGGMVDRTAPPLRNKNSTAANDGMSRDLGKSPRHVCTTDMRISVNCGARKAFTPQMAPAILFVV